MKIKELSCVLAWASGLLGDADLDKASQDRDIKEILSGFLAELGDGFLELNDGSLELDGKNEVQNEVQTALVKASPLELLLQALKTSPISSQEAAQESFFKLSQIIKDPLSRLGLKATYSLRISALFYVFLRRWAKDELRFSYIDSKAHERCRARMLLDDARFRFSMDEALFGPLAKDTDFRVALKEEINYIRAWHRNKISCPLPSAILEDSCYMGIDLGTSSLKCVLMAGNNICAQASVKLSTKSLEIGFSEQDPNDWIEALKSALKELKFKTPANYAKIKSIGFSGQMHGLVLLDASNKVLRPAILWNDTRSVKECEELAAKADFTGISANLLMPGFMAPKLLWVQKHEPQIFAQISHVLLPKDYLLHWLSGAFISDFSDASGSSWLDVANRRFDERLLKASSISRNNLPALIESCEPAAFLSDERSYELGLLGPVLLAAGAGDNAASALGLGLFRPKDSLISLGTSGVVLRLCEQIQGLQGSIHSFAAALPNLWLKMSVSLNAGSALRWFCEAFASNEREMFELIEGLSESQKAQAPLFLPYLSGERTPCNDAKATASLFNLRINHSRAQIAYAVAEGIGFALKDGLDELGDLGDDDGAELYGDASCGAKGDGFLDLDFDAKLSSLASLEQKPGKAPVALAGGGSQSLVFAQLLADILELDLELAGQEGAAIGAARLGAIAQELYLQGLKPLSQSDAKSLEASLQGQNSLQNKEPYSELGGEHCHFDFQGFLKRLCKQKQALHVVYARPSEVLRARHKAYKAHYRQQKAAREQGL